MQRVLLVSLLCFLSLVCRSRETDSVWSFSYNHQILASDAHDSVRLDAGLRLTELHRINNIDSALHYIRVSKQLANQLDIDAQFSVYRQTIFIYNQSYEMQLAVDLSDSMLTLDLDTNFIIEVLKHKSAAFMNGGEYSKSQEILESLIEFPQVIESPTTQVEILTQMGVVFGYTNQFYSAIRVMRQGLELVTDQDLNRKHLDLLYLNLGASYLALKNNPDSAIFFLSRAEELAKNTNNSSKKFNVYTGLLEAFYQKRDFANALDYAQKAEEVYKNDFNPFRGARLYMLEGAIYNEQERFNLALEKLLRAEDIAVKNGFDILKPFIVSEIAKTYSGIGNYKKAFSYFQQGVVIEDSINRIRSKVRADSVQLALQNQLDKFIIIEKDLRLKQAELDLLESANRTLIGYSILVSIIVIGLVLVVFFKNKYANSLKNYRAKIKSSNSRISEVEGELDERTKSLHKLEEQLLKLAKEKSTGIEYNAHDNSKFLVESYNYHNQDFHEVFPEFLKELKRKHPTLTQNELRICTLIRLNLSLYEISKIQSVEVDSIRKARYRIYKKMRFSNVDELTLYLFSI